MDELIMFDFSVSNENMDYMYNGGAGRNLLSASTPTVIINSPVNGTVWNTHPPVNFTPTMGISSLGSAEVWSNYSGNWSLVATDNSLNTSVVNSVSWCFGSCNTDGDYSIGVKVNDTAGNVVWTQNNTYIIDSVVPSVAGTIFLNKTNAFSPNNLVITFNASDSNLYRVNVSDSISGTLFFMEDINTTLQQVSFQINTSLYNTTSRHVVNVQVADGHTALNLAKDYDIGIDKLNDGVTFGFDSGSIRINPEGVDLFNKIKTQKEKDRYTFSMDNKANTKSFVVTSNGKLTIKGNQKGYNAWIIDSANNKWVDFNLKNPTGEEKYVLERIDDKNIRVTINNILSHKVLEFQSIGDLNVLNQSFEFVVLSVADSISSPVVEGQSHYQNLSFVGGSNATQIQNSVTAWGISALYNGSTQYQTGNGSNLFTSGSTTWLNFLRTAPTVNIPSTNISTSWMVNMTSTGGYTSYLNLTGSQLVYDVSIDNCAVNTFPTLQITAYNEEEPNQITNVTIDLLITVSSASTNLTSTLNMTLTGNYTYTLCSAYNSTDLTANAIMSYQGDGDLNSNRKYYLYDYALNTTLSQVNIYALNYTIATAITHLVSDRFGSPIANVYIKVVRKYLELDQDIVVEIGKTDNEGKTGTYQILFDPLYYYILDNGTETLLITTPGRLLTASKFFTIGDSDNPLTSNSEIQRIQSGLTFDNATQTFSFVWNDLVNIVDEFCLEVYQRTNMQDTNICPRTNCASGSAGTLTCVVPGNITGIPLTANVYLETNTQYSTYLYKQLQIFVSNLATRFGIEGVMGGFLLVASLGLAFTFSPPLIIIGALLGLAGAVFLMPISPLFFLVLAVCGGIFIAKMNS